MTTFLTSHKAAGLCIVAGLIFLMIVACGDSETETASPAPQPTTPPVAQASPTEPPAPTAVPAAPTAAPAPTAKPAVATPAPATQPPVVKSDAGPSKITTSAPFAPSNNGAVETDDSFIVSRAGVTETLVKIDFDGEVKPYLADSWSLRDGNAWEFKLRQDVSFQDGAPFDSESVVMALDYLRGVPNPPRGFTEDTLKSVTAADSYTVIVESGAPDVLLPTRLAVPTTGILTPAAYEGAGSASPSVIDAGHRPLHH